MKYINTTHFAAPKITWSLLFPEKFWKEVKYTPDNATKPLTYKQPDFLRLLPIQARAMENGRDLTELSASQISRYFNCNKDSAAQYRAVKANICRFINNGNYSYRSSELTKALKSNVLALLNRLDPQVKADYMDDVHQLIHLFVNGTSSAKTYSGFKMLRVKEFFDSENTDFSDKLACLILIAATWYYWDPDTSFNEDADDWKGLYFALPFQPIDAPSNTSYEEWRDDIIKEGKEDTAVLLAKAELAFRTGEYETCGDLCCSIINSSFAEDAVLGKAYYLLVRCREEHHYIFQGFYDSRKFKHMAISYGCPEAAQKWKTLHLDSLLYEAESDSVVDSLLVFNTENERTDTFLRSVQEQLSYERDLSETVSYAYTADQLENAVMPWKSIRFLLLDENREKNFQDLLHILNRVKTWNRRNKNTQRGKEDCANIPEAVWRTAPEWRISVYIRIEEETYSALLDTALKHMEGIVIPVHVIDEAKWTAQNLLARHPLFYPIRSLSENILTKKNTVLNYVVIAGQDDDLTRWLIREAYWLGCFWYKGITFAITVLSPEADRTESWLRFNCPGMFGELPDSKEVSEIKIAFQTLDGGSLFAASLFARLDALKNERNVFSYFVINADSDISGLNLAVRIREWSIQNIIHSKAKINRSDLPVIAYHCVDSNISHLSDSMIVQMEEHGDSWYNNYSLIPFGMLHERYTWDHIDGGYFEKVAQSTHLQYCGAAVTASAGEKSQLLEDYFTRCYNRDSSRAVALSLPYRLFQTASSLGDHIIPNGWSIYNKNAYTDCSEFGSVFTMAELFQEAYSLDVRNHLTMYEHSRWMRWIVSRGWKPADADQTIMYIQAGNPRQQLYIGRLHSCLCPLADLEKLQKTLYEEYELTGNKAFARYKDDRGKFDRFLKTDQTNIESTPDLLKTSWLTRRGKIKEQVR